MQQEPAIYNFCANIRKCVKGVMRLENQLTTKCIKVSLLCIMQYFLKNFKRQNIFLNMNITQFLKWMFIYQ